MFKNELAKKSINIYEDSFSYISFYLQLFIIQFLLNNTSSFHSILTWSLIGLLTLDADDCAFFVPSSPQAQLGKLGGRRAKSFKI